MVKFGKKIVVYLKERKAKIFSLLYARKGKIMALSNLENRVKQDTTYPRTAEDAILRSTKNIKIVEDEVTGLTVEVSKKVGYGEIISSINASPEQIAIQSSKIKLEGYTTINGGFSVDEHGNAYISQVTGRDSASIEISDKSDLTDALQTNIYPGILELHNFHEPVAPQEGPESIEPQIRMYWEFLDEGTTLGAAGCYSPIFQQTSEATKKKNFEKSGSALDIIKDIDIYKYNLKSEADGSKKHYGFVIGDNYKYSKELTGQDNKGVDLYSFISVCCKAIQEQQKEIEELKKKVNK